MESSNPRKTDFAARFLDSATRQSEILSSQIATLSEIIPSIWPELPDFDRVSESIKEAMLFSAQISSLLTESRAKLRRPSNEGFVRLRTDQILPDPFDGSHKVTRSGRQSGLLMQDNSGALWSDTQSKRPTKWERKSDFDFGQNDPNRDMWGGANDGFRSNATQGDRHQPQPSESSKRRTSDHENLGACSMFQDQNRGFLDATKRDDPFPESHDIGLASYLSDLHLTQAILTAPPCIRNQPDERPSQSFDARMNFAPYLTVASPTQVRIAGDSLSLTGLAFRDFRRTTPKGSVDWEKQVTFPKLPSIPPLPSLLPVGVDSKTRLEKRIAKRRRGTYRICPAEIKEKAINLCKVLSVKKTAETLNVSQKSVKRWMRHGIDRVRDPTRVRRHSVVEAGLANSNSQTFQERASAEKAEEEKACEATRESVGGAAEGEAGRRKQSKGSKRGSEGLDSHGEDV